MEKKLTLSNFSFHHANAEVQALAIRNIEQARKVFGDSILISALKRFNTDTGIHYNGVSVSFVENEGGSWALIIREIMPNQRFANVYADDTCAVLLGWGYKAEVMTGEIPISDWGHNGNYYILDVDCSVIQEFKKSTVSHYGMLDTLIKNYKEANKWDESIFE